MNSRAIPSPERRRRSAGNEELPLPDSFARIPHARRQPHPDALEILENSPASTKTAASRRRRPRTANDPPPSYPSPLEEFPARLKFPDATSARSISSSAGGARVRDVSSSKGAAYPSFPSAGELLESKKWAKSATKSHRSAATDRDTAYDTASESGASVLSAFHPGPSAGLRERDGAKLELAKSNSPLRRWARWMRKSGKSHWSLFVAILLVMWVKWSISLGSYSGARSSLSSFRAIVYFVVSQVLPNHRYEAISKRNDTGFRLPPRPSPRPFSLLRIRQFPFRSPSGTSTISPTGDSTTRRSPPIIPSSSALLLVFPPGPPPLSNCDRRRVLRLARLRNGRVE